MPTRNVYTTTNINGSLPVPISSITATRNTDNFLYGYDLSGISIWDGTADGGNRFNHKATLISNRHVLLAQHTLSPTGLGEVAFINNNNQTFVYTVTGTTNVFGDLTIGVLNTTVDSSLKFYKVLPQTFQNLYLRNTLQASYSSKNPLYVVYSSLATNNGTDINYNYMNTMCIGIADLLLPTNINVYSPLNSVELSLTQTLIPGDSGNPCFTIINNELVLLCSWLSGTPNATTRTVLTTKGYAIGAGPFISSNIELVNNTMTTLAGTSYALTEINITNFHNFGLRQMPTLNDISLTGTVDYRVRPTISGRAYPSSTVTVFDSDTKYFVTKSLTDTNFEYKPKSDLSFGTHYFTYQSSISRSLSSSLDQTNYVLNQMPEPVISQIVGSIYSTIPAVQGTALIYNTGSRITANQTPSTPIVKVGLYINDVSKPNLFANVDRLTGNWGPITIDASNALPVGTSTALKVSASILDENGGLNSRFSTVTNYTVTKTPKPVVTVTNPTKTPSIYISNIIVPQSTYVIRVWVATDNPPSVLGTPSLATADGLGGANWTSTTTLNGSTTYYIQTDQRWNASNISDKSDVVSFITPP